MNTINRALISVSIILYIFFHSTFPTNFVEEESIIRHNPNPNINLPIPISNSCSENFIYAYATDNSVFNTSTEINGTNILIGGSQNGEALIVEIDNQGSEISRKKFNVTNTYDQILKLIVLTDGNIVGIGRGGGVNNATNFLFKFNPINNSFLWFKSFQYLQQSLILDIIQIPNANFLVFGQVANLGSQGCNALFMEIDNLNGDLINIKDFHLGSCETINEGVVYNNNVYTTGRFNNANGGTNKMRPSITSFDLNGNPNFSKLYLTDVANTGRLYPNNMIIEEDNIFVVGQGDLTGNSATDNEIFFYKTNILGEIDFGKYYNIENGNGTHRVYQFLSLADGFLLLGDFASGPSKKGFVYKLNKSGELQWAKSIDVGTDVSIKDGRIHDGSIFLMGSSNDKALLIKLSINGDFDGDCQFINELQIDEFEINNPYEGERILNTNVNVIPLNSENITTAESTVVCSLLCGDEIIEIEIDSIICAGDSVFIGTSIYSETGIYSDTIMNAADCDSIVNLNLEVQNSFTIIIDSTICAGDSIMISNIFYSVNGMYRDTLESELNCDTILLINIEVDTCNSDCSLTYNIIDTIFNEDNYFINIIFSGMNTSGRWFINEQIMNSGEYEEEIQLGPFNYNTPYDLLIQDDQYLECQISISFFQTTSIPCPIFFPNVFSPNGDNINDRFYPIVGDCDIEVIDFKVYNRWGDLVFSNQNFSANDPSQGWNGKFNSKQLNSAVFVYYACIRSACGFVEKCSGSVTLIQ